MSLYDNNYDKLISEWSMLIIDQLLQYYNIMEI